MVLSEVTDSAVVVDSDNVPLLLLLLLLLLDNGGGLERSVHGRPLWPNMCRNAVSTEFPKSSCCKHDDVKCQDVTPVNDRHRSAMRPPNSIQSVG